MLHGTFYASFNSATIFGFYFHTFSGLEEHPQYIGISIHIILQYLPPFQHFLLPSVIFLLLCHFPFIGGLLKLKRLYFFFFFFQTTKLEP